MPAAIAGVLFFSSVGIVGDGVALLQAAGHFDRIVVAGAGGDLYVHIAVRRSHILHGVDGTGRVLGDKHVIAAHLSKIGVELPIYHGTSDAVLQVAAGHLEGTSLPVGGASTHAVISAHRGLPSAKLFTNLDQLEVGDTFTITVLDRTFTYEVDNISIVLPTETDSLKVVDGKDYVTLMTCTPYGINTHRLLVRGRRITTPDKLKHIRVTSDAIKIEPILTAPIMALPLLLVLLFWLLFASRKRSSAKNETHKTQ